MTLPRKIDAILLLGLILGFALAVAIYVLFEVLRHWLKGS